MSKSDSDERAQFYDEYVLREQGDLREDRIRKIIGALPERIDVVLDIGCGRGTLLRIIRERFGAKRLVGVDLAPETPSHLRAMAMEGYASDASAGLNFETGSFDVVVCGEVIEHVVDTDGLVSEILRVLKPGGVMVLTTPNLAYALNRAILLLGLQPLFTETSLRKNMGRRWRFLGQSGPVQGHLKVFTIGALRELVTACGFEDPQVQGYRFFQTGALGWIDGVFSAKSSLAAGFVLVARKGADA